MNYLQWANDNIGLTVLGICIILVILKAFYEWYKSWQKKQDILCAEVPYPNNPSFFTPKDPFKASQEIDVLQELHTKRNTILSRMNQITQEANNHPLKVQELQTKHNNDLSLLKVRLDDIKREWYVLDTQLKTVNDLLGGRK